MPRPLDSITPQQRLYCRYHRVGYAAGAECPAHLADQEMAARFRERRNRTTEQRAASVALATDIWGRDGDG